MNNIIKYKIYEPCGNDTALVLGTNYTPEEMKNINDFIMNKHKNVEQVGFIDTIRKELIMAGGEFCGNATRCAAFDFLFGSEGFIDITVNKNIKVKSGIDKNGFVFSEIPLPNEHNLVDKKDENIYIVRLSGITMIVCLFKLSIKHLNENKDLQSLCKAYIDKYNLQNDKAVGLILLEKINNDIKIIPIVWVKNIETCFLETACGSGTIATCIVLSYIKKESLTIDIVQPSNDKIKASVDYKNNIFSNAIISGKVDLLFEN